MRTVWRRPDLVWQIRFLIFVSASFLLLARFPPLLFKNLETVQTLSLINEAGPSLRIPDNPEKRVHYLDLQDRVFSFGWNEICSEQTIGDDLAQSLNCLALFVWQTPWSRELETIANRLASQDRKDANFLYYLAQIYHRRGELDRAKVTYKRLLSADPGYFKAYLALGALAEARSQVGGGSQDEWEEAIHWYNEYRTFAPNDLYALYRLKEICKLLKCETIENLQREWDLVTNDVEIVAGLLEIDPGSVEIGDNLLREFPLVGLDRSEFSIWKFTRRYQGIPTSGIIESGNFVSGLDTFITPGTIGALRIDGLLQEPVGGYAGEFDTVLPELTPGSPYLLTFFYKSDGCSDFQPSLWAQLREEGTLGLPATGGEWWRFALVAWSHNMNPVVLQLQNYGACQVWFADIRFNELRIKSEVKVGVLVNNVGVRSVAGVSSLGWNRPWWK